MGFRSGQKGLFSPLVCSSSTVSSRLPCDLNSLMELKRAVDFQFVQLLTCKDRSYHFQASDMIDQKLEVF